MPQPGPFPYNNMPSELYTIALCESGGRQFNANGSLVRDSVTGTHVGIYQLGSHFVKQAREMGLDVVKKPEDNIKMAIYIYNTQGTAPWLASKDCWGKNSPDLAVY